MHPPRLSLVVPSFNEARILPENLDRLHSSFPEAEIILVSDGSSDRTESVPSGLSFPVRLLEHHPNRGKGFAIRRGVLAAEGELIVFTDADLPFGVEGVRTVVERLEAADAPEVVIASKATEQRGLGYLAARAVVRLVIRAVLGLSFPDTQAGLKGFRRDQARTVFCQATVDRFATDLEILYIARRHDYRVLPVLLDLEITHFRPSSFTAKQGLLLLRDIWRIRRHPYR